MTTAADQLAGTGNVRIGADIGGTFTDIAAVDTQGRLHIGKRLTTHGDEHDGVITAINDTDIELDGPGAVVAHGTTLVINALLERKGAKVALVTTKGFADSLDIGRGNRSEIFTLRFHRDEPLVPRELRFEIDERALADGSVERQPSDEDIRGLIERLHQAAPEAIAVGFLHSYVSPDNERLVADRLRKAFPGMPVTSSSDLSRQWREFERFTTATANAFIAPVFERYLGRLTDGLDASGFTGDFVVLDSSGGAMTVDTARRFPVRAVESGPVGGVIFARSIARRLGIDKMVTFDMGGTTAKSALIEDGDYPTRDLYWIGGERRGFPLQVSTVDILEVGVGGGSIAWVDKIGRLRVGPRSAGSVPGPACYGRGGTLATVTDANVYCGRIDPAHFAGTFSLDVDASRAAIELIAGEADLDPDRAALGILRLANMEVASTVRRQTLERGNDPREYALLASGGGGPLHGPAIAQEVGIGRVVIPRFPGHFSALGMLEANLRVSRREVLTQKLDDLNAADLQTLIDGIAQELTEELRSSGAESQDISVNYAVALRFSGQEHSLWFSPEPGGDRVPADLAKSLARRFKDEYQHRYGHLDELSRIETAEVEVIAERALPDVDVAFNTVHEPQSTSRRIRSLWSADEGWVESAVIARASLRPGDQVTGPAVIHEVGSTTALPPGSVAVVDDGGVIVIDYELTKPRQSPGVSTQRNGR
jgi:N-methylhydantoinase A